MSAPVQANRWPFAGTRRSSRCSARHYSPALSFVLVLPLLMLLGLGFLYPIATLLKLSLFTPDLDLSAYRKIVEQPLYLQVMLRTFKVAFLVTLASLLLGYPIAFAMTSLNRPLAAAAAAAVFIALWSPVLVRSYAWIVLLQRNGVVNQLLGELGVIGAPLKLIYNEGAVILAMTHVLLPFMILPIFATLRSIPAEYAKAARNLGAGTTTTFLRITVPLSLPGVFAGCVMCFILAIGFYITPALLGGPGTLMVGNADRPAGNHASRLAVCRSPGDDIASDDTGARPGLPQGTLALERILQCRLRRVSKHMSARSPVPGSQRNTNLIALWRPR
jgi:mannopine transport system permease protein